MTLGQIAKKYASEEKLNCAVSTLLAASDVYGLGITKEEAKLITGFGGGIGCGNLCGALAGAVAALGKVLLPEGEMYNNDFHDACAGLVAAFEEKWGSTLCAPIKEKNATPEEGCRKTIVETGDLIQEYFDGLLKK